MNYILHKASLQTQEGSIHLEKRGYLDNLGRVPSILFGIARWALTESRSQAESLLVIGTWGVGFIRYWGLKQPYGARGGAFKLRGTIFAI